MKEKYNKWKLVVCILYVFSIIIQIYSNFLCLLNGIFFHARNLSVSRYSHITRSLWWKSNSLKWFLYLFWISTYLCNTLWQKKSTAQIMCCIFIVRGKIIIFKSIKKTLKGQCHESFALYSFVKSLYPGPKYFFHLIVHLKSVIIFSKFAVGVCVVIVKSA